MIDDLPLNIVNVGFHSLHWPPMAQGPGARAAWVGGTLLQGAPLAEVSSPLKVRVSQCALLCPHGEERHLHMAVEQSSAAVLHHLWNWEDAGATHSSIFLFPQKALVSKERGREAQRGLESISVVCELPWLSQPLGGAPGREETCGRGCSYIYWNLASSA